MEVTKIDPQKKKSSVLQVEKGGGRHDMENGTAVVMARRC